MGFALTASRSTAARPYLAAIASLFARTTGGMKFGLDTTRALLDSLGNPHERFASLHVAGTNGKGSTVHMIDALLRDRGLRVARYTSPHLVDFRERIVVDGVPIPESAVVEWIERAGDEVNRLGATFFEATTCLAFDWFARSHADIAVVEVGLGGRLDSTNVLTPLVAGVTSIGLDHTQYLGDTIDDVAREKAGIYKAGVLAVVSDRDPRVRSLLAGSASDAGASVVYDVDAQRNVRDIVVDECGTSFTMSGAPAERRYRTPLLGEHQAHNTAIAISMVELAGTPFSPSACDIDTRLATVRVPGRFDRRGRWIFDVAHNPDGARALAALLDVVRPARPVRALFAVLADKDWRTMMRVLAPSIDELVLTYAPSAPPDRLWPLDEARAVATELDVAAIAEPDFDRAIARAAHEGGTTLVTGSFHTVGDCMARLQIDPLAG